MTKQKWCGDMKWLGAGVLKIFVDQNHLASKHPYFYSSPPLKLHSWILLVHPFGSANWVPSINKTPVVILNKRREINLYFHSNWRCFRRAKTFINCSFKLINCDVTNLWRFFIYVLVFLPVKSSIWCIPRRVETKKIVVWRRKKFKSHEKFHLNLLKEENRNTYLWRAHGDDDGNCSFLFGERF